MFEFDLRHEDEDGLVRKTIAFAGMDLRLLQFPVGTIVGFAHTEFDPAAQPANDVPAPPTCHGYVQALGFDGWGNPHYDIACIQHGGLVREVRQYRLRKVNLLEQLAIASAGKLHCSDRRVEQDPGEERMKPFVYEEIVTDPAAAKTLQLEPTPEGDILLRTIAGNGKGKSQKIAKLVDAPNDPHIELIKKTFEDPAANGPSLESQLNDAHEKLKRPKVRWLKDATPAPPDAAPVAN